MKNAYLLLTIIFLLFSCKKEKADEKYTDLTLEDAAIQAFFKANPENEKIKKEVKLFYKNRDFQYAWFTKNGITQAVPNFQN